MPHLSDLAIKAAIRVAIKTGKGRKLYDSDGLYLNLEITKAGKCSSCWRQKYFWAGSEKLLSHGVYPLVSLLQAREKRDEARRLISSDIDPSADRKAKKVENRNAQTNTFRAAALLWHSAGKSEWSNGHAQRVMQRLEDNLFPWIGATPLKELGSADVIQCINRIVERGAADTARRVFQYANQVLSWAVTSQRLLTSPIAHLKPKDLKIKTRVTHRAAITNPSEFGALLRAIDGYQGSYVVRSALQFLALTFARPGELRSAEWLEFALDGKEPLWRIPAAKMKMGGADHLVPLSRQAVKLLRELKPLTGADDKGLVFPGERNASRPMSENTLNAALRSLGIAQEQHCSHGFRSTASTLLNEQQWHKDAIERQLAHMPRDHVRAAYNSAEHLPERRRMMQAWADYLDGLMSSANASKQGSAYP